MHGVFTALINGVHEKGGGGVLWVRGDTCKYCFPDEFTNKEFVSGLELMLSRPQADSHFFVVTQKEDKMDVMAYPRTRVYEECREELLANKANEANVETSCDEATSSVGCTRIGHAANVPVTASGEAAT